MTTVDDDDDDFDCVQLHMHDFTKSCKILSQLHMILTVFSFRSSSLLLHLGVAKVVLVVLLLICIISSSRSSSSIIVSIIMLIMAIAIISVLLGVASAS